MKQAFYINGACYGRNWQIWEPVSTTQPWPCILISVLCKMKILYCFHSDKWKSHVSTKNSSNNKGAYKVLSETPTSPLAPKDNLCSAWCVSPQCVLCVSIYMNMYKNEDMLSWWQLLFSPVMLSTVGCGSLQSPEDGKGPPLHGPPIFTCPQGLAFLFFPIHCSFKYTCKEDPYIFICFHFVPFWYGSIKSLAHKQSIFKRIEIRISKWYLCSHVHRSIIHNSQHVEIT